MRAAITSELLRKLPSGPCDIWDLKLPGFVLRVRESGHASYAVIYGRGKKLTLGGIDALKPAQARELARQTRATYRMAASGPSAEAPGRDLKGFLARLRAVGKATGARASKRSRCGAF
jgi:hypothetical protein